MKPWVTQVTCSLALFFCLSVQAGSAADELQEQLKAFSTYQADFSQQTLATGGRLLQRGSGIVKIKRPGKFFWLTKEPTEQHLISDGKTLWVYDVDLAQATSQALSSRTAIDPAALLSGGVTGLNAVFTVRAKSNASGVLFTLIPKHPDDAGFASMQLDFQQRQLKKMSVVNNLAQTSEFTFTHVVINQPLNDQWFTFHPPRDVDVVAQ